MSELRQEAPIYIRFDLTNEGEPLRFADPVIVLQADRLERVNQVMDDVQQYLDRGYYAAGYISYEAAPAFDPSLTVKQGNRMPLCWFGIFEAACDEGDSSGDCPAMQGDREVGYRVTAWQEDTSQLDYESKIGAIKDFIGAGATYQVNYTIRMHAQFEGDDYAYYLHLLERQQATYSAYLNMGKYRVLSLSPELFVRMDGNRLETRPMKGTIGRGDSAETDSRNKEALAQSQKDRAENVMIVDLLRSDLGRISKMGSVRVDLLFAIETYNTVFQMTSTISAETPSRLSMREVMQAVFPCGSVTGAPKRSTMEIIEQLESSPREVYCGALGYMTPHGKGVFNVPIRTAWLDSETGWAEFGVGGGVTWDSTSDGEYEEVQVKAKFIKK
ncbi:aminodeoxychorismate synthase component I [Paenibacillus hexagrammi]|uniref:Aminodeoxychorismate synthase component I n=1 Tax=Paenibacillus hexagrammi TaxID=2908839 RepID=A0ABY3SE30_9BACL|nr:aminodeoxychorismate synthase component I [Paenibacillus sp. YPD9-1]UJF31479.1 aminodeoxychorismate synthase component I [Paenibacillus sp. YPD9-1]